jgi:molecular chaperone GrpE
VTNEANDQPEVESAEQATENKSSGAQGNDLTPEEHIATLKARLQTAERQVALIRQAHTEAAAEFDKTKTRLLRNHEAETERARHAMTRSLFDVADNLDRTIEGVKQGGDAQSLLDGVTAVKEQFLRALGDFGLERFEAFGKPFDPSLHNAIGVLAVVDPLMDNVVVAVLQPGFRAGETVLRPAMVQVGKYQEPPKETDETVQ